MLRTRSHVQRVWRVVQVLGTVVLIGVLVREVDWTAFQTILSQIQVGWLAGCGGLLLLIHLLNAWRWQYLLKPRPVAYRRVLYYYLVGLFANNFLPTGIGGDGVRTILVVRDVPAGWAIMSVSLDRLIGLSALIVLISGGVGLGLPTGLQLNLTTISPLIWLLPLVVVAGVAATWRADWLVRVRRAVVQQLKRKLATVDWPSRSRQQWGHALRLAFLLSVAAQVCLVAANAGLMMAVGVRVPIGAAVWGIVLSSLSLLLPISINGLGLQENLIVVVLQAYGVPAVAGLSVAVLWRLLNLLMSLAGAAAVVGLKLGSSLSETRGE